MARELKRVGIEHQFVQIFGGGHGFDGKADDPQTVKPFERVMGFLDKHLKKPRLVFQSTEERVENS